MTVIRHFKYSYIFINTNEKKFSLKLFYTQTTFYIHWLVVRVGMMVQWVSLLPDTSGASGRDPTLFLCMSTYSLLVVWVVPAAVRLIGVPRSLVDYMCPVGVS